MAPAYVHTAQHSVGAECPLTMTVRADDVSHSATVAVAGELDLASADRLAATLEEQTRRGRRYVRVDVSELTFLDATALGVLAAAHHDLLACRGTLIITGVKPAVSRLLHITGLDGVLFASGSRAHPRARRAALRSVAV